MDQGIFKTSFQAFPLDAESIDELGRLLQKEDLLSPEEWANLRANNPEAESLVEAVAARENIDPVTLAKLEASILNMPFINLEEQDIPLEAFKLIPPDSIKTNLVIPIQLSGQELLVGAVNPAIPDLALNLGASPALGIRLAKVLADQLDEKIDQMLNDGKASKNKKKGQGKKRLGDILIESKYITDEQLGEALKGAKNEKLRMGAYLVKHGILTNKQLSIALSKQFSIPFIDLDESLVDPVLATLLPKKLCYEQILCPVKREKGKLVLAMTDPTDIITIDHIEMMTGMRVSPVVSSELSIMSALGNLYGDSIDALADGIGTEGSGGEGEDGLEFGENDAPIIKLVNLILTQAYQLKVSDIHIEVYETELRVRFRQDGVLKLHMTPAKGAHAGVISRIKVMANLDIAETRKPQDGRIKMMIQKSKLDLRVSCIPCVWGEKVVMRLLDQGNLKVDLTDLGFEPHVLETFMEGVRAPNGIVLVTGPTGSGKTTTLYSALHLLNNPGVNIMTAEDPVEYNLMGINQVQCHADIGLDFSAALRSFLRQDPDVVMLGEIRDYDSASIAIKAAMTGHLVISTLHTNDAPSTVARLLNMGIEPFSLSTALRIVEAQRLVRRICKTCKVEYTPDKDLLRTLGVDQKLIEKLRLTDKIDLENIKFYKGQGCPECDNSGMKGRQGIYEVLNMTQDFKELVEESATTEAMRRQALADGMLSLRESALYKLLSGATTVEEVVRTTIDEGADAEDDVGKTPFKHKSRATLKAESDAAAQAEIDSQTPAISTDTPIAGLGDFTKELHEFTSALKSIGGDNSGTVANISNELLKKGLADPLAHMRAQAAKNEDAAKVLPLIQAQGQKMDFNLKNLLAHFGETQNNLKKIQLNELIEKEIFGRLKEHVVTARLVSGEKEVGKGLKVSKSLPKNLPSVAIDIDSFKLIATNLFINALLAVKNGGEIKVVTRLKPKTDNVIEFIIFDSGDGIKEENQKKLFIPFSPIERKTLGLGLSVVKKLVESQKGKVSVKSTPGTSTLVTVAIPTVQ